MSEVHTFSQFIAEAEDGRLAQDLSTELSELIGDLSNHAAENGGKAAGTMTITFGFKVDGGIIEVGSKVATKRPDGPRERTIFWATPGNGLTRSNPRQQRLPLHDVTTKREIV